MDLVLQIIFCSLLLALIGFVLKDRWDGYKWRQTEDYKRLKERGYEP